MPRIKYILYQLHQQLGPEGWILADPTGSKQQSIHGFHSTRQRFFPVEGNAAWRVMPFGLHSASATFSKVFDRTHDKTTEGKPKRSVLASKGSKPDGESGKMRIF